MTVTMTMNIGDSGYRERNPYVFMLNIYLAM